MVALLVIDMQVALFAGPTPRHDAEGVFERINSVARAVRAAGGDVVFIQHDSPAGTAFEPGSAGWEIVSQLERTPHDAVVRKTACDAFYETELASLLERLETKRLIVTGCATDFCVDTTVRAAASRDFEVAVVADGHTTADRDYLAAPKIIEHHNAVWRDLILPRSRVEVLGAADVIRGLGAQDAARAGT